VHRLLGTDATRVAAFDINQSRLEEMERGFGDGRLRLFLGDVTDSRRLGRSPTVVWF
jgi:hypothetical protein